MALIKCPECQKEISDSAASCPNCGNAINKHSAVPRKKKRIWLWILVGLVFLAFIGVLVGDDSKTGTSSSGNAAQAITKAEPAFTVTPDQICEEYDENEIAADEKYKGKLIRVSGYVEDVGKDVLDDMYISFKRNSEWEFGTVQCYFSEKHANKLSGIKKGSQISIQGTGDGLFGNVFLRNCTIVE